MELKKGSVVRSKAGRDKGKLMAVVDTVDKAVLLCDGKERRLEKPKRKNLIHIAPTSTVLQAESLTTNHSLKRALNKIENERN